MIKTIDMVEAAIWPEYLYSISIKALEQETLLHNALKADVDEYRQALPKHAQQTFDRHLEKTVDNMCIQLFDKKANEGKGQWDAVKCFAVAMECLSHLNGKIPVTERLAAAVERISSVMEAQFYDTWEGMLHSAGRQSRKMMKELNAKGYFND